MPASVERLLQESRKVHMSTGDRDEQRESFAYGTAKIENSHVTREMIRDAADRLSLSDRD